MEWFLPCLYAFLGCGAFCFIFELRRWWYIVSAAATGTVAWLVYLSLPGLTDVNRYLLATIAAAALSEIFARLYKTPATVFLIIGIIPLVPGGGIYYTMEALINGDLSLFVRHGMETAASAGASRAWSGDRAAAVRKPQARVKGRHTRPRRFQRTWE